MDTYDRSARKNETLVYEPIESLDDLPQGYSTEQKPGRFRLFEIAQPLLRYHPGAHSWKQFLFPLRSYSHCIKMETDGKQPPDKLKRPASPLWHARL
jgi:hypothetical protein